MFVTRLRVALVVLLLGVVAPPAPSQERPGGKPGPRPEARGQVPTVWGVVASVDAGKSTLTVKVGRGEQEEKTFAVAKDADILLASGRGRAVVDEGKLADLHAGSTVTLMLSADGKSVETIVAEGPTIQGVVKSVDAAKGSITLMVPPRERGAEPEEKTFSVGKKTEIALDDGRGRRFSVKEGKLADVPAGAMAAVRLSVDQKSVASLTAEGPMVHGVIKSVDAPKHTITVVQPRRGEEGEEKTITLAKDADVLLGAGLEGRGFARGGKLSDLHPGSIAMVKLSLDQKTATVVRADGPVLHGVLKGVDAGKGTLTLLIGAGRGSDGEEKTFTLAKKARIFSNGKVVKLGDLKPKDDQVVRVKLSLDQKLAEAVQVLGEEIRRPRD
jgi:hypothetical protein